MHRVCVSGNKNGGVQFGLAFVLRGGNTPFLRTSVHFASMIDNVVLEIVEYFWTLQKNKKTKCNSSVEKCSSWDENQPGPIHRMRVHQRCQMDIFDEYRYFEWPQRTNTHLRLRETL